MDGPALRKPSCKGAWARGARTSCVQPMGGRMQEYTAQAPSFTWTRRHPHPGDTTSTHCPSRTTPHPLPAMPGDPTADASIRASILATTFVWLDCFSSPQPPPADTAPRRSAVDAALSQCSSVVLLLDSTAAALSRTWCLYEASRALAVKGIECLHVPVFEFALDIVYEPLQALSYTSSESYSPMDKRELLAAVAEQYGQVAAQEEAGGGSRRSPRLSGALGAANRALIGGIQVGTT